MIFQQLLEKSNTLVQIFKEKNIQYSIVEQSLPHHRFSPDQYLILYFSLCIFTSVVNQTLFLSLSISICILFLTNKVFHYLEFILTLLKPFNSQSYIACFSSYNGYLVNEDYLNPWKPTTLIYCHLHPLNKQSLLLALHIGIVILPFIGIIHGEIGEKLRIIISVIFFFISCFFDIPRIDTINQVFSCQLLFSIMELIPQTPINMNIVFAFVAGNQVNTKMVQNLILVYDPSFIFYVSSSDDIKISQTHGYWEIPYQPISVPLQPLHCSDRQNQLFESCDFLNQKYQQNLNILFHHHPRYSLNPFISRAQVHFIIQRGHHKRKHNVLIVDGQLILYLQNFAHYVVYVLQEISNFQK
ncbi:hypothetical protein ENU1_199930 [Entamoeba nuttalli P19]|uniref:Transmembrane protein n=1 Tax=Entamoeba nuttalli (strain P19) TaxID=1076696 RepID=K2H4F4_ENTNP|nr:hypothetical protein ENU1_199930 [Entamoeba nuttalli P19]EKE37364.1 hypothetical protein ENU1_199930 [Entamoeba nuttalli P19]|eukprot:XP_008860294.1 hypothetical protein ENU1_199930 [Entamoeba nuttalli P19]